MSHRLFVPKLRPGVLAGLRVLRMSCRDQVSEHCSPTASLSHGSSVLRSITSQLIPLLCCTASACRHQAQCLPSSDQEPAIAARACCNFQTRGMKCSCEAVVCQDLSAAINIFRLAGNVQLHHRSLRHFISQNNGLHAPAVSASRAHTIAHRSLQDCHLLTPADQSDV